MTSDLGPHIKLVAAVIEREGRYLITQRRPTAVLPGLWEFPGGKVEPGESDESALKREMRERVGVEVEVKLRMAQRTHKYDGYSVDLTLYQASILPAAAGGRLPLGSIRGIREVPVPGRRPGDHGSSARLQALVFIRGAELGRSAGIGIRQESDAAERIGGATDVAVPAIAIVATSGSAVATL
jgi:8-oxo-dGTP pyrophosphatase MutT (NUDIX family)